MKTTLLAILILGVLVIPSYARGKKAPHYAPLASEIMTAKTVYIQNSTPFANLSDKAYKSLVKWGRYQIVESPQKADLIFRLSFARYGGSEETSGTSHEDMTADSNGAQGDGTISATTYRVNDEHIILSVIDAKIGRVLYQDTRTSDPNLYGAAFRGFHGATHLDIVALRKRIEAQEETKK